MLLDEIDKMGADSRGDPPPRARGARPGTESPVHRSLPRRAVRSVPRHVPRHRQRRADHPGTAARSHGDDRRAGVHRGGEAQDRHATRRAASPREHGLARPNPNFESRSRRRDVVRGYTREAGVRGLQRCWTRSVAPPPCTPPPRSTPARTPGRRGGGVHPASRRGSRAGRRRAHGDARTHREGLGPPRYEGANTDLRGREEIPGVVAGLSWTAVGGDLMYIEAAVMPGKGDIQLTGQLGDVIKESALIALSWVQSHARALGLTPPAVGEAGGGERRRRRRRKVRSRGRRRLSAASRALANTAPTPRSRRFRRLRRRLLLLLLSPSSRLRGWVRFARTASTPSRSRRAPRRGRFAPRSFRAHPPSAGRHPEGRSQRGRDDVHGAGVPFQRSPRESDTAMTGEVSLRGSCSPWGVSRRNSSPRTSTACDGCSCREMHERRRSRGAGGDAARARIVPCVTMADVLENAFEGGYDSWDARRCEPGGERRASDATERLHRRALIFSSVLCP